MVRTHWGLATLICVDEVSHHWFGYWHDGTLVPSHCRNKCWRIVNRILELVVENLRLQSIMIIIVMTSITIVIIIVIRSAISNTFCCIELYQCQIMRSYAMPLSVGGGVTTWASRTLICCLYKVIRGTFMNKFNRHVSHKVIYDRFYFIDV